MGMILLRFSFVLLYGITLFFGMKSIISFWQYSTFVGHKSLKIQQKGIIKIGDGLFYLLLGFALATTVGAVRTMITPASVSMTEEWKYLTITTNYLWIIFPALGLWFILTGAILSQREKLERSYFLTSKFKDNIVIAIIFSSIVTILYTILIFSNPNRQVSSVPAIRPTYFIRI